MNISFYCIFRLKFFENLPNFSENGALDAEFWAPRAQKFSPQALKTEWAKRVFLSYWRACPLAAPVKAVPGGSIARYSDVMPSKRAPNAQFKKKTFSGKKNYVCH